ncbi:MAG: hypothetical protein ABIH11_00160 [Candidatus Altiarchaeota archaeon]
MDSLRSRRGIGAEAHHPREPLLLPFTPKKLDEHEIEDKTGKVLHSINSRSLRRRPRSGDDDARQMVDANNREVRRIVGEQLAKPPDERRIRVMFMWGGFKEYGNGTGDRHDEDVVRHLKATMDGLSKESGVPFEGTILFCDIHSRINGHPIEESMAYRNGATGIEALARENGLGFQPISEVYMRSFWGDGEGEFDRIMREGVVTGVKDFERFVELAMRPGENQEVEPLVSSARKHSEFVRNSDAMGLGEKSAGTYYAWRKFESELLSKRFPDSIFVSFSSPTSLEIHPKPTLYWWALHGGDGTVPWFQPPRERQG